MGSGSCCFIFHISSCPFVATATQDQEANSLHHGCCWEPCAHPRGGGRSPNPCSVLGTGFSASKRLPWQQGVPAVRPRRCLSWCNSTRSPRAHETASSTRHPAQNRPVITQLPPAVPRALPGSVSATVNGSFPYYELRLRSSPTCPYKVGQLLPWHLHAIQLHGHTPTSSPDSRDMCSPLQPGCSCCLRLMEIVRSPNVHLQLFPVRMKRDRARSRVLLGGPEQEQPAAITVGPAGQMEQHSDSPRLLRIAAAAPDTLCSGHRGTCRESWESSFR